MKPIRTVLKAVVSIGLLAYLIYIADPEKILQVLDKIWSEGGLIYLTSAAGLFLVSLFVLSWRWHILVRGYGIDVPIIHLFKYYLIGLFFNNFLPTGIGGDVLRIYNLLQETGERTISFASVISERLLGITSTLILTIISIIILQDKFESNMLLYIALLLMAGVIMFFVIAFSKKLEAPIQQICNKITFLRLGERIEKFLDAIRFYSDSKSIYLKILFISLISQTLIVTKTYLLAKAVGVNVAYEYLFLVVPITFLLMMVPSINGIGFRDGGYVVFLAYVGVSKAEALSLSFLTLFIPMLISIGGGILFMMQKKALREEGVKIVEENF